MKVSRLIPVLVVIISLLLHQAPASNVNAVTTVNVAFLSPETGTLSAYSSGIVNAGKLAFDELVVKYPSITWNWKVFDTKTTPQGAAAAMIDAVDNFKATFVVGAFGSPNTLSAAAIAKTKQVPLISYGSTNPELSDFDDDGYLWRVVPSDGHQGVVMADIAEYVGYKTAVVLHVDNAYGAGVATAFKSSFNGTIAKTIPYNPLNFDAVALVDRIDAESPDVLIYGSYYSDGSKLFVQMADQNLNIPIIGGDGVADNAIFDVLNGTAEAMLNLIATKPTKIETDATKAFAAAYKAAGYSGGIYTGESYDAVWIGALAVVAADSNVGADIIVELANTNFDGGSGKKIFDSNGDVTTAAYLVMQVQYTLGTISFVQIGTWIDGTLSIDNNVFNNLSPSDELITDIQIPKLPIPILSMLIPILFTPLRKKFKH